MNTEESELIKHIRSKITYHDKLRLKYEAEEDYIEAAKERDEIKRLKGLIGEKVEYEN